MRASEQVSCWPHKPCEWRSTRQPATKFHSCQGGCCGQGAGLKSRTSTFDSCPWHHLISACRQLSARLFESGSLWFETSRAPDRGRSMAGPGFLKPSTLFDSSPRFHIPFVQWIRTEHYERSNSGSNPERDTNSIQSAQTSRRPSQKIFDTAEAEARPWRNSRPLVCETSCTQRRII